MTRKLKFPGGKGDAMKKKSEMDNADKRGKGKKNAHGHDEKHDHHPQKAATSAARKRWNMPAKVWDSTFANLRIQLNTIHRSGPRKFKKPKGKINYCVKKLDKMARPAEVTYAVRRNVAGDMDSALWMPERLDGLRFENSLPVSHSILGTVSDYLETADNRIKAIEFRTYNKLPDIKPKETGFRTHNPSSDLKARRPISGTNKQIPELNPKATGFPNSRSPLPDIKPRPAKGDPAEMNCLVKCKFDQGKALKYWENEITKGHDLGEKISLKCKRSQDDLIMGNHPYKVFKGQRRVFDDLESAWQSECRVTKSNGFWKQREQLGDTLRGIHMARTKQERGINPEPEVVYRAGSDRLNDCSILDLRINGGMPPRNGQMHPSSFDIHCPSVYTIPEIVVTAINEPTIEIGQHVLSWSNRDCEVDVELGIVTCPGQAKMGNLAVKNIGACVVKFELFKIPKTDHFDFPNQIDVRDSIFLGHSEAIVLPEDFRNISAIFHSHRATTCSEKWRIETTPRLARDITLTIWGIAKNPTELGENGKVIEEEIKAKILESFIESILDDIIEKICCIPPPARAEGFPDDLGKCFLKTPVGNDLFTFVNPGLTYHSGTVSKILEITEISLPVVTFTWSLPLNDIRLSMCDLPEEVKFKNNVVSKNDVANVLMTFVNELSYDVKLPMATRKYDMCKKLLVDVCNNICDTAARMKKVHGITLDMDFSIDVSKEEFLPPPAPVVTQPSKGHKTPPKSPPKTPSRDKSKKKPVHKVQVPKSPPPESGPVRLGKIAQGIKTAKKSQYKNRAKPIMYFKYLEKLNLHSYFIVKDFIDKFADYLSDLPGVPELRM